jgi:hypothetical protein
MVGELGRSCHAGGEILKMAQPLREQRSECDAHDRQKRHALDDRYPRAGAQDDNRDHDQDEPGRADPIGRADITGTIAEIQENGAHQAEEQPDRQRSDEDDEGFVAP